MGTSENFYINTRLTTNVAKEKRRLKCWGLFLESKVENYRFSHSAFFFSQFGAGWVKATRSKCSIHNIKMYVHVNIEYCTGTYERMAPCCMQKLLQLNNGSSSEIRFKKGEEEAAESLPNPIWYHLLLTLPSLPPSLPTRSALLAVHFSPSPPTQNFS